MELLSAPKHLSLTETRHKSVEEISTSTSLYSTQPPGDLHTNLSKNYSHARWRLFNSN